MNSRLEGPITSLGKFKPLLFMRISERFLWVVGKRLVPGQLRCVFLFLHSRSTRGKLAIDSIIPLGCHALQTAELSPRRACPSDWRRPASTFTEQISADLLLWLWSLTQATSPASGKVLSFAVLCFPGSSDVTQPSSPHQQEWRPRLRDLSLSSARLWLQSVEWWALSVLTNFTVSQPLPSPWGWAVLSRPALWLPTGHLPALLGHLPGKCFLHHDSTYWLPENHSPTIHQRQYYKKFQKWVTLGHFNYYSTADEIFSLLAEPKNNFYKFTEICN